MTMAKPAAYLNPPFGSKAAQLKLRMCMALSFYQKGSGPTSPYWTSGLNGFLIKLGGALLADQGFTLGRMADRIWQIALATPYVSFFLAVLAMLQDRFSRPAQVAS